MLFKTPPVENVPVPEWFRGFSPRWSDLRLGVAGYRRNLPHWRHEGGTYFITFRLNDSLPAEVVARLRDEDAEWQRRLAAGMTPALRKEWEEHQRRRFEKVESLMDAGHGSCVLRDPACRAHVTEALLHFENERCRMVAFAVMPNHVHALVHPLPGWSLEDLAGSWKKFTAERINRRIGKAGQVWQRESFDRIARDGAHFGRIVRYIAVNPEKARLREDEATVWLSREIREANGAA